MSPREFRAGGQGTCECGSAHGPPYAAPVLSIHDGSPLAHGHSQVMETTTVTVEKRKNRSGSVSEIKYTVKRRPVSLSEMRMRRDRWWDYAVDHITESYEVEITVEWAHGNPITEKFFEFVTPFGRGCVVTFSNRDRNGFDHPYGEVDVFIPNKGKALLVGFWTKHGHKVGHAGSYARAMGVNPDSRTKTDHTCPARVYDALRGMDKRWV